MSKMVQLGNSFYTVDEEDYQDELDRIDAEGEDPSNIHEWIELHGQWCGAAIEVVKKNA